MRRNRQSHGAAPQPRRTAVIVGQRLEKVNEITSSGIVDRNGMLVIHLGCHPADRPRVVTKAKRAVFGVRCQLIVNGQPA